MSDPDPTIARIDGVVDGVSTGPLPPFMRDAAKVWSKPEGDIFIADCWRIEIWLPEGINGAFRPQFLVGREYKV